MRIHAGSSNLEGQLGPSAVAIGIFDGVHVGHQRLLNEAVELARGHGLESLAYSFHPHPAQAMAPDLAPKLIETIEARLERISALAVDTTLIEPFDAAFASRSADAYVRELLVGKLRAKHVIVGRGFVFGHGKSGDVPLLEKLGAELGFETHAIEPVKVDGIHVSSTKIREFITAGRVRGAGMLLGRPYELRGAVIRGDGRGSKIGIPTANVEAQNEALPGVGVYAGWVNGGFVPERQQAVINVGFTPTFGSLCLKIEAHILDFEARPLYGNAIAIDFIKKLRAEERFDGVAALKAQIHRDIAAARVLLGETA